MKPTAARTLLLVAVAGAAVMSPRPAAAQAQAAEPSVVAAPPVAPPPSAPLSAAQLLAGADAAVDAGNLEQASALYDQIARFYPGTPEAGEAHRALKILGARQIQPLPPGQAPVPGATAAPPAAPPPAGTVGVVVRREPYSLQTSEKLRLSTWEKMDFGVTSFLYGMSVGFSLTLAQDNGDQSVGPVALGAIAYTLGAVAYLNLGDPDRGDLPLALAITSFLPTTTLLVANIASTNPDEKAVSLATGVVGLLSVPVAIVAARNLELDPGDTQLVRDAGFWGLVLGTTGMLAFGGETRTEYNYTSYHEPSNRKLFTGSMIGLYGGLALGTVGAVSSEVSLERVRVSTWGGYGGAVIGLLLGASSDTDRGAWTGITIGALGGLLITFLSTSSLDGIPPDDATVARRTPRRPRLLPRWRDLAPAVAPVADANGGARTAFGVSGTLF
ncbi:MAG TPA: hypothetical protein VIQ54_08665 [Polyangia bacterium]|jgi:hypothetical protein